MNRILKNTSSNVIVLVIRLAITFVMTPIIVAALGNYDYGIWEMIISVVGYMGMLDLGLRPAVLRFAARYHAQNDRQQMEILFSTTGAFMLLVGVICASAVVAVALLNPGLIAEDGQAAERYGLFMLIIALQVAFEFPGQVAESFLEGFQYYQLRNRIVLTITVISAVILYFYLTPENGLILLALVTVIGTVLKYLIFFVLLHTRRFNLRFQFSRCSIGYFKEIIGFGFKSFVQGAATRIESGSDIIIIGALLNPAVVVFYAIPAALIKHVRNLAWTLTHAMMPVFSDLHARGDLQTTQKLMLTGSKAVIALLLPMAIGLSFIGDDFIGLWMGAEYGQQATWVILWLLAFYLLPFINPFSSRYLTAIGEHAVFAKLAPVVAAANILLSLVFVRYWGIEGVAAASLIPTLLVTPVYLSVTCRHLGISVTDYLNRAIMPLLLPNLVMGLVLWVLPGYIVITNYLSLLIHVIAGAIAYSIALLMLGISTSERQIILNKLRPS